METNKNYLFECTSGSRQGGFYHACKLYLNGNLISSGRANYCNRTWERFPYDTVKKVTISKLINKIKIDLVDSYKIAKNVKRLSTKSKEAIYSNNEQIKELRELYNTIG